MLFFYLIFLGLYLIPVVPVARRIEYVRTRQKVAYTLPARKVTRAYAGSEYVYVNDNITEDVDVCDVCGGNKSTHKGGIFKTLRNSAPQYMTCEVFIQWDGKRNHWDEQTVYYNRKQKIAGSLAIAAVGWVPLLIHEGVKAAYIKSGVDPKNFAVPYHGVETSEQKYHRLNAEREARAIEREKRIEELERENKALEAKL